MQVNHISVGVIGAGVIGSGIIKNNNKYTRVLDKNNFLSHSAYIDNSKKFKLNFIIETNNNIREILKLSYKCKILSSIKNIKKIDCPEIISICIPDEYHYQMLEQVIDLKPRLVIIEKPISTNPILSKKIFNIYKNKKIKLLVNYSRRFIPFFSNLSKELKKQKIISSQVYYANGLLHNGCHIIDLFNILFGAIKNYKELSYREDFSSEDPTVSAFLSTENCKSCFMIGLDNRNYVHWEMNIFTNKFMYRIHTDHRKLSIKKIKSNSGTPSGKRLIDYKTININYDIALKNLYLKAKHILDNNLDWEKEAYSALQAENIAHKLLKKAKLSAINNN